MDITWHAAKREANIAKHGMDFTAVGDFAFDSCLVHGDTRFDHGEFRLAALGLMGVRLQVLVLTIKRRSVHMISLRKANSKEFDAYVR